MTRWRCGIRGCESVFETAENLIRHQATDHRIRECEVCGEQLPAGYLAIRHVFEAHTRAEYVRAYDADSDDIRRREEIKDRVEEQVNVAPLIEDLGGDTPAASAEG